MRPDEPRLLTLLGRIHLAWPVVGRFRAESLLTRAGALDPDDPEPFYHLGLVGLALHGDDGEAIARRGFTRVLELAPDYRDAWARWVTLYRGPGERRAGVAALARHAGEPAPDVWRSQLLMELEAYDEAEPLLRRLVARETRDPTSRALLAQLLFETGRDDEAAPMYAAALARAAADTGATLWRQVRSIASPAERTAWAATRPERREDFLRRFWVYRDPSVRTASNERVGEHFRRLREARRLYALLHPSALFHHSRLWRALAGGLGQLPGPGFGEIAARVRSETPPSVRDTSVLLGFVAAAAADTSDETPNLEDFLDDRGRVYVRHGSPDERSVWNLDAETWRYHRSEGVLQITFARRTGGWGLSGDAVVTPFSAGEPAAAGYLLATDRPSSPATLPFDFWTAAFRGASPWQTELVLFPDSVSATAVLFDDRGREIARDSATRAPLHLHAPPGRYLVALDAARADRVGRYRGTTALPPFTGESLAVSSLLLTTDSASAERQAMERAAPAGLRLPADRPIRFYAEVYGVAARDGASRYDAAYVFERSGGRGPLGLFGRAQPTRVVFTREQRARRVTIESLVIDPGRLPRGTYRMRLDVHDAISGARASSASLQFDLR